MLKNLLMRFFLGVIGCVAGSAMAATNLVLPSLPEPVTSFGAYSANGWVYVFGGHKGQRHDYCEEMVSGSFNRLKLDGGTVWEPLASSTAGQGVSVVANKYYVYRVGGMAAHNHTGTKQNLYSETLFEEFDLRSKQWEQMPPLPEPRSSHDTTLLGDKIYAVGGWNLRGASNKPVWLSNAVVFDLKHSQEGWKTFPQPFKRRALAVASKGTRLYCIGGMDSDNKLTASVDIYDTASQQWTKGPDLPAGEFKGFACSAIAQDGRIYATALAGDLLRLSKDEKFWEVVGKVEKPRLAHRLVTDGRKQLLILGGEDGEEEKVPGLQVLTPSRTALAPTQSASAKPAGHDSHQ